LQREGLAEQERRDYLLRSQAEVNRIDAIITRMLNLARPSAENRQPVGVHRIIAGAGQLVTGHPLMAGIELAIDPAAACDRIMADGDQIHQVLLNLLLNAADAIAAGPGSGGRIAIATANVQSGSQDTPQEMLRVTVADNGVGIPADQTALVFDPFFTTKAPGRGTGLGLAVSLAIIEAHGGTLTVDSAPGRGATFTIELPLIRNKDEG